MTRRGGATPLVITNLRNEGALLGLKRKITQRIIGAICVICGFFS